MHGNLLITMNQSACWFNIDSFIAVELIMCMESFLFTYFLTRSIDHAMAHWSYPPLSSREGRRPTKRSLYAKATRDKSWAVRLSRIRRLPRLHTQPRKDKKSWPDTFFAMNCKVTRRSQVAHLFLSECHQAKLNKYANR